MCLILQDDPDILLEIRKTVNGGVKESMIDRAREASSAALDTESWCRSPKTPQIAKKKGLR